MWIQCTNTDISLWMNDVLLNDWQYAEHIVDKYFSLINEATQNTSHKYCILCWWDIALCGHDKINNTTTKEKALQEFIEKKIIESEKTLYNNIS